MAYPLGRQPAIVAVEEVEECPERHHVEHHVHLGCGARTDRAECSDTMGKNVHQCSRHCLLNHVSIDRHCCASTREGDKNKNSGSFASLYLSTSERGPPRARASVIQMSDTTKKIKKMISDRGNNSRMT